MGFDLYGLNPQNPNNAIRPEQMDWNKNPSDKEKDKYFDDMDKYQGEVVGDYFRNNVWFWRPLWDFVCYHCNGFLTPRDCSKGGSNSGDKISKTKSIKIAKKLFRLIEDGTVAHYEKEYALGYEQANEHNAKINKELDKLKKKVNKETNKDLAPANYPEKYKKEWDKIYAKTNWTGSYPFSAENVKEFAKFCEQSGGFEIC